MTFREPSAQQTRGIPTPAAFGVFRRLEATDNERAHPGLGVSIGYRSADVEVTLYVYDLGLDAVAEGALSEDCSRHFLQCIRDTLAAVETIGGRASLLGQHVRGTDLSGPEFLRASFVMEDSGGPQMSVLLLTGIGGQFVKLRLSCRLLPEEALAAIESASDSYSELLWPDRSETRLINVGEGGDS
jgi:hypothetical protein